MRSGPKDAINCPECGLTYGCRSDCKVHLVRIHGLDNKEALSLCIRSPPAVRVPPDTMRTCPYCLVMMMMVV
jgi:hypothetical protein